ncbi:hypothetical protein [Rhizobium sp. MHM7A]|uniref:hypothetical protein n=1 Tax=Rhizobium sp. MHM7A TaxID=2583233 RepID=UPI001105EA99|nr:hypothetical protein [Rhizobium sp. MHM7A]TLX16340.1 hypothetical protein FFR93_03140 [Rhizobium sp. MHM7A]
MSKKKFTYPQLALCDWLFEANAPGLRFLTLYHGSWNSSRQDFTFHEITEKDENGLWIDRVLGNSSGMSTTDEDRQFMIDLTRRLGGSLAIDCQSLCNEGILTRRNYLSGGASVDEFSKKFVKFELHHNTSLIRRTATGRDWWIEQGKALYEAEHQKRLAKRKDAERTIVIGAWMTITATLPERLTKNLPEDMKLPTPKRKVFRPFATATVQSQSEKRIGVTNIQMFDDWEKHRYYSSAGLDIKWPILGREPNFFISPENLMVDHADNYIGSKLHNLHSEEELDFSARATDHMSKIVPLMLSMHLALDQQKAGLEDMTREMIQNFTGNGPGKLAP